MITPNGQRRQMTASCLHLRSLPCKQPCLEADTCIRAIVDKTQTPQLSLALISSTSTSTRPRRPGFIFVLTYRSNHGALTSRQKRRL
jgi:hypothetical protein